MRRKIDWEAIWEVAVTTILVVCEIAGTVICVSSFINSIEQMGFLESFVIASFVWIWGTSACCLLWEMLTGNYE